MAVSECLLVGESRARPGRGVVVRVGYVCPESQGCGIRFECRGESTDLMSKKPQPGPQPDAPHLCADAAKVSNNLWVVGPSPPPQQQ
jgi:hypothetical protein